MSKKKNRLPPFIYITKEMFRSDAFLHLTNTARITYFLLQDQITKANQTKIICPYAYATKYMSPKAFTKAISQLVEAGFIEKNQKGGLYRKTNIYKITDYWKQFKK